MNSIPDIKPLRLFISAEVDPRILERLREVQAKIRATLPPRSVRWTRPEQIHLTLKFLGNVHPNRVEALLAGLERAVADSRRLELEARDIGCFPDARRPKVIWTGLGGDLDGLLTLQRRIEEEAAPFAESAECRAFRPHLTLGRCKSMIPRKAALEFIDRWSKETFGRWTVRDVRLMASELSSEGSAYSVIGTRKLQ